MKHKLEQLWAEIKAMSRKPAQPIVWTRDHRLIEHARDRYLGAPARGKR